MSNDKFRSARTRIVFISLILGLVFIGSSSYLAYQYMGNTKEQRLSHLRQICHTARNTIEPVLVEYRAEKISRAVALEQIRNLVRRMVYSDHIGENYVFMSSYEGIMLVQPFEPEKEMTDVWDLKDSNGEYIIRALVKAAKSDEGQGYVSYHYQRPGEIRAEEKISFVMGIPELGCYIGTGQYMEDLRRNQLIYIAKVVALAALLLVLLFILGWASVKEIRRQNQLLGSAERELAAIFHNTFQFIGALSVDGRLVKSNRSARDFIEQDEASVVGKYFWDTPWWQKKDRSRLKEAIRDCSKGKFIRFETVHIGPNKKAHNIDFSLTPIRDEKEEIIYLLAEGRDITEQVMAKNELIREKDLSENLINSLPGIFFLYKRVGDQFVLKKWNQNHAELLGYSFDDLQNAPLTSFFREEDLPFIQENLALLEKQGHINVEFTNRRKDGVQIPFLISARTFERSGELFIIGTGIEITQQKQAQEKQKKLEAMFNQAQKMDAIGHLAGGVAHDFNNMLSGIMGGVTLLERRIPMDQRSKNLVRMIKESADRASGLTNKLLAFARRQPTASTSVDVHQIIRDTIDILKQTIDKRISISLELFPGKALVIGDDSQLQNVFLNLGINASHAMPDGGTLSFSSRLANITASESDLDPVKLQPGPHVEISVMDTGTGIPPEILPNIFEPFFTTKEPGKGTGLGLAATHGTITQHKGSISVTTEVGKGTVFTVLLPLSEDAVLETSVEEESISGEGHILLVDDESVMRATGSGMLEFLGYTVETADNGSTGLNRFKQNPNAYDLVILDMIMPVMSGRQCFEEIKKIAPDVRVVLASGFTREEDLQIMKQLGLNGFIRKPFRLEEFSRVVAQALE